jgi:hypothetical protein
MIKPRILIIRLNDAIRSALSRAMPSWREKISLAVIAVAILLFGGWYWRYGGPWKIDSQKDAQLANGWVMNCSGPEFTKFSKTSNAGSLGTSRPIFRINDQLVLAVPQSARPSAGRIESEPRECRTSSDLPKAPYLYFVIRGNWSGRYDPKDVPLDHGRKRFLPDAVTVRIEQDPSGTSTTDERRKVEQIGDKFRNELLDQHEIGGLTCGRDTMPPHPGYKGGLLCWSHRTAWDRDTLRYRTFAYEDVTPFVWIDAHHGSKIYGGILVYWDVWTLDLARARDIDQAIWNTLAEWNLAGDPATQPVQ